MDHQTYIATIEGERNVFTSGDNMTRLAMWYILCAFSDDFTALTQQGQCGNADCTDCKGFADIAQRLAALVSSVSEPMLPGEIN